MISTAGRQKELQARLRLRLHLKGYLPSYPSHIQRMLFKMIIKSLAKDMRKFKDCDWSCLLGDVKAILADDDPYASQREFPFLSQALQAESVQDLEAALKVAHAFLEMPSLRAKVRAGYSCHP